MSFFSTYFATLKLEIRFRVYSWLLVQATKLRNSFSKKLMDDDSFTPPSAG